SPVLVLLHGTNDQAGTWARIIPLLINRYRLILPDLAGHGESEPKTGPIAISVVVDRLRRIIDHERVNDITLGGNSFGAWIALLYTLAHPEKVKRLVLESGGGLARPLGVPLVARDRETAMTILRGVHGPSYVPEEWVIDTLLARANDSPLLRLEGAMESFVDARVGQLDKPSTLIWGADDGVVPVSYGEALQKLIRGATLHVIEGAAHIPHLQQPERFVECLTATS
ncbi:MAG TPA: alpha/beta hydrolase, partial [Thermoanaerobaculia bacterium]